MMELINSPFGLGAAAVILAIWISREIMAKKSQKNGVKHSPQSQQNFDNLCHQVRELYKMHDQKDNDGVYIWYVRRSLEDAINKLADNVDKQTQAFTTLVARLEGARK